MATGITQITITHPKDDLVVDKAYRQRTLAVLSDYLDAWGAGVKGLGGATVDVQQSTSTTDKAVCAIGSDAVAASGTVTISSGSGTIDAVVNGVTIGVTWATSDTHTGDLLAAAINGSANALVSGVVTASNASGVVTVKAKQKGICGNWITLAASGTGATASGARLTGGVDATAKLIGIV